MLQYLDEEGKRLSRDLWEEAFPEDSKSFDDYYYRVKTKDNRILAAVEEDWIQAMLQMNPYRIRAGSCCWQVDYLVGVATRTDKRHQGYMRRLLVRMMADMRKEEMPFCFLMPADEAIYRPFGFTYIFRQPQWELQEDAGLTRRKVLEVQEGTGDRKYLTWLADWMNRWLAGRYQVYAVRDTEYLQRLLEELASENGSMEVLYDGDRMVGIQSFWGWKEREQRLLYCEAPYVRETEEAKPAIMARIITPEQFVKAIHLKSQRPEQEVTLRLELEDPLIAENHGAWLWHLERESSWLERAEADTQMESDLRLTITELTSWLFGYEVPEAAQPYAELIEPLSRVFLDEAV